MRNLPSTLYLFKQELGFLPEVIVVWAQPEPGALYIMNFLKENFGARIIGRPAIPHEGAATSYPESHNLRLGLENAAGDIVVGMSGDVHPRPGVLREIMDFFNRGEKAVLYFWENGISRNAWHSNFFAITNHPDYYPPLCAHGEQDTLEVKWGKQLTRNQTPFLKSHNSQGKKFSHRHESETYYFPAVPVRHSDGLSFYLHGKPSVWKRILGVLAFWRKSWPK